jgi:hypothetical protein
MDGMPRTMCMIVFVLLLGLHAGCAGPQPVATDDPMDVAPMDFSIDLAIVAPRRDVDDIPIEHQPARYMLLADGTLHFETEPGLQSHALPGYVRTLTRRQVALLWSTLNQTGLADPANGDPIINPALVNPPRDHIAHVLTIHGHGRHWMFTDVAPEGESIDPALARLTRELAALVWADERYRTDQPVQVLRYDYGDDPYAQYRE